MMLFKNYLNDEQIRHYNSHVLKLVSFYLNIFADTVDLQMIDEMASSCDISRQESFCRLLAALLQLDSAGRDKLVYENYFVPMVHELNVWDYKENLYYKNIKIPNVKFKNWELKNLTLKAGEGFVCDDFVITDDKRLIPQIGFFALDFVYLAVLEDGREWMTLLPNEVATSQNAIERSCGRVLTYGLGLGYFAYMASVKSCVDSVTVVELNENVIELFKKYILPQFEFKEKITIIKADALKYAQNTDIESNFDFVFADIWRDASDGKDLYLKLKSYEKPSHNTEYTYWLEDSIKPYLNADLWPLERNK